MTTLPPVSVVLTDEELHAIVGDDDVAVRPFVDGPAAAQLREPHDVRIATAVRGLVARGLVVPVADEPSPEVEADLASLLRVRREAQVTVMAARRTSAGSDVWYLYRSGSEIVLETVTSTGLHVLEALTEPDVMALARAVLVDPEAPDDVDPVALVRGPIDDPAAFETALARCRLGVDLTSRAGSGPTRLDALWSGPDGCWHLDLGPVGSGTAPAARPVGAAQLLSVFADVWSCP